MSWRNHEKRGMEEELGRVTPHTETEQMTKKEQRIERMRTDADAFGFF